MTPCKFYRLSGRAAPQGYVPTHKCFNPIVLDLVSKANAKRSKVIEADCPCGCKKNWEECKHFEV